MKHTTYSGHKKESLNKRGTTFSTDETIREKTSRTSMRAKAAGSASTTVVKTPPAPAKTSTPSTRTAAPSATKSPVPPARIGTTAAARIPPTPTPAYATRTYTTKAKAPTSRISTPEIKHSPYQTIDELLSTLSKQTQNLKHKHEEISAVDIPKESLNRSITNNYEVKLVSLIKNTLDFRILQTAATRLIEECFDADKRQKWDNFCKGLGNYEIAESEKIMLMHVVLHCISNPITNLELMQFLALSEDLKSIYGTTLHPLILEADVLTFDRHIQNYVTVFQLLIDLEELPDCISQVRKYMPNLPALIAELKVRQEAYLAAKYKTRDINEVIERFATKNELTQFSLPRDKLATYKDEYLAIMSKHQELKSLTQVDLKDNYMHSAKQWQHDHERGAKIFMLAIICETLRRTRNIFPKDTQIITVLALLDYRPELKGRIAQMKTGEGKSPTIAILTAFNAALGRFQDVITSNSYLAIRDSKLYAPFYNALGLTVSHISHETQKQSHFHAQILYGTNYDFEFALLRDFLNEEKLKFSFRFGSLVLEKRTEDDVVVDEADSLFLDTIGAARMAFPGAEKLIWLYEPILNFVKKTIQKGRATYSAIGALKDYLETNFTDRFYHDSVNLTEKKLKRLIVSAQSALYKCKLGRDYLIADENIRIVDFKNTGRSNQCQWQHGIHQFLQAKHNLEITPELETAAAVSHPAYFSLYKSIYGLTGTMGDPCERDEVQEIYGVDTFDVPPYLPSKRIILPPQIVSDTDEQKRFLLHKIQQMQRLKRPSLILYETIEDSEEFSSYLRENDIAHQVLNEKQKESEEYVIARAGTAGMVTVATNTAGRGTDIITEINTSEDISESTPTDSSEIIVRASHEARDAGGLFVAFAFYPANQRVTDQGFGRTARQEQPGSGGMVLHANDPSITSLLEENTSAKEVFYTTLFTPENAQAKLQLIDDLRSKKIEMESRERQQLAKLETLYFNVLTKFSLKFQNLYTEWNHRDFKISLLDICLIDPAVSPDIENVNEDSAIWTTIFITARIFIDNQREKRKVDWSSFLSQFKSAYFEHIQTKWASFYGKLADDTSGMDVEAAQSYCNTAYQRLNIEEDLSPIAITNCLRSILHLATQPPHPKKSKSTSRPLESKLLEEAPKPKISATTIPPAQEVSTTAARLPFFSKQPMELYKEATALFRSRDWQLALETCQRALSEFLKTDKYVAIAHCYSTEASCYRELKQFKKSFKSCVNAFSTLEGKTLGESYADVPQAILTKYESCLRASGFTFDALFITAIKQLKEKHYQATAYLVCFLLENIPDISKINRGLCYSILTTCYKKLHKLNEGIDACEQAITIFREENNNELEEKMQTKLQKLVELREKNQMALLAPAS